MNIENVTPAPSRQSPGWLPKDMWLILVYITPPTIWSGHLLFAYLFVSFLCPWGGTAAVRAEIGAITFITLAVIAACAWIAWVHAAEYGANLMNPDEVKSRSRGFLAHSAVYTSAVFFIATLFEAAPAFALEVCAIIR